MAYQVLARKWRPRNFSEMVGQAHVLRALVNALENNRLHHAYLFTGTRGVGKTTIARILSKSLNCEKGVTAHPCGQCTTCQEIDEGRFIDLIEVDAASRTKVEDTRELLENVQYAPTRGRYKVYLIDEVHMLSTHSFNALLKTLEEPPLHIKFLLATTDPQKLPPTVLSRCLQFNLKRLPIEYIAQHLQKILDFEKIDYELPALQLLAQAADGSLRDALSLLDQAIAYGGGHLFSQEVSNMLGTLDHDTVLALVKTLASRDGVSLLQHITQLSEYTPDYFIVLGEILSLLQRVALAQVVPNLVDQSSDQDTILQLAHHLSPEDVQLFYQIGLLGRRDLPLAPDPKGGFEMILLRMLAFRPERITDSPASSKTVTPSSPPQKTSVAPPLEASPSPPVLQDFKQDSQTGRDEWANLVHSLSLNGMVKQLALNCFLKKHEEDHWYLGLPQELKSLLTKKREEELQSILQNYLGKSGSKLHISVEYTQGETPAIQQQRIQEVREQAALIAIESDPFVKQFIEQCGAKINQLKPSIQE